MGRHKKYKNLTNESGVYGIFLDEINMVYIGSCKQFNQRWTQHLGRYRRHKHDTRAELLFAKGEELGIEPYMKILEVTEDDKKVYESREYEIMKEYANNGWCVVNCCGMRDSYNKDIRREKERERIRKYNAKRCAKEMQERIDKRLKEGLPLTNKQKEFLNIS